MNFKLLQSFCKHASPIVKIISKQQKLITWFCRRFAGRTPDASFQIIFKRTLSGTRVIVLQNAHRSQVLPRKIGKCALNDPVFKFKIYFVEMQDFNTKTNLTGLLLVFDFGSDSEDFDQELL